MILFLLEAIAVVIEGVIVLYVANLRRSTTKSRGHDIDHVFDHVFVFAERPVCGSVPPVLQCFLDARAGDSRISPP